MPETKTTYLTNAKPEFEEMQYIFCRVLENGDVYQAQGYFFEATEVMWEILNTMIEFDEGSEALSACWILI